MVSGGNGSSIRSCEGISGADELSLGYTCYIWESMNQKKHIWLKSFGSLLVNGVGMKSCGGVLGAGELSMGYI